MGCGTIISIAIGIIGLGVAIIGLNFPIIKTPHKHGWKHDKKGVGISYGNVLYPKAHPTTDSLEMEKDTVAYDINYGITIKNLAFTKAEIYLTTVKLFSENNVVEKEYRGRWWDRTSENLYRASKAVGEKDDNQVVVGGGQEKDLILFYEHDGAYYLFSTKTDRQVIHPDYYDQVNVPCYG